MTSMAVPKITRPETSSIALHPPSYSSAIARNRFFHILWFLHFKNNANLPKRDDPPNHDNQDDKLSKIQKTSHSLNNKFCEMYNPTEHLAVDEVIVLYIQSNKNPSA